MRYSARIPLVTNHILVWILTGVYGQASDYYFKVQMYGANELGHPGDPAASGTADLDFDGIANTLQFDITCEGLSQPITGADVNFGSSTDVGGQGTAGASATIVTLVTTYTDVQNSPDGTLYIIGTVPVQNSIITNITRDPQHYYVQVYTLNFPYGAMRGQLQTAGGSVQVTVSDNNNENWPDAFSDNNGFFP